MGVLDSSMVVANDPVVIIDVNVVVSFSVL